MHTPTRITATAVTLGLAMAMLAGCASTATAAPAEVDELRLGYFANVTHAPALIGVGEGLFDEALGQIALQPQVFGAGPAVIEALSAGALDAAYVGPNPAINTFIQSAGASVRVIAGATSGGAALVVRDGIDSPGDLVGTTLASPQLGNTQDVALRSWLYGEGFETTTAGGGEVRISPTENAQTLTLFQRGEIDGAWLPEPWVSRLVVEGGAQVLVDERELWADGTFPTTVLVVRTEFAQQHPEIVDNLLEGHLASLQWITDHPNELPDVVNAALSDATGKPLDATVLQRALSNVTFGADPLAKTFPALVSAGIDAGTQREGSIEGLFDLSALNRLQSHTGAAPFDDAGLGAQK